MTARAGRTGNHWKRGLLALSLVGCLLAAFSSLNAGSGNLGRTVVPAGGGSATLTQSSVFPVSTSPGQAMTGPGGVVTNLVALINADANFQAAVITDPNDPTAASFSFLRAGGTEVSHIQLCETDPNIDNIGVVFPMGADPLVLTKVTTINANGTYRLTIDVWDGADFDQTFTTSVAPNNTAAGLNASLKAALQFAGYTVVEDATNFTIRKPLDKIISSRMSCSDTGVVNYCLELTAVPMMPGGGGVPGNGGGGIPTLSDLALVMLALLITALAIMMMRRKRSAGGPGGL